MASLLSEETARRLLRMLNEWERRPRKVGGVPSRYPRNVGGGGSVTVELGTETEQQVVVEFDDGTCARTVRWFKMKPLTINGVDAGMVITGISATDPSP